MFRRSMMGALALMLSLSSCSGDTIAAPVHPRDDTFAPELGVDLDAMTETPSGLFYQDLVVGEGDAAAPGHGIVSLYTGWFTNGVAFGTTDGQDPFLFILGMGAVIRGWDEGIVGMREGGIRLLVIPPHLAYGAAGSPPRIPPNATVVYRVELVSTTPPPTG